MHKLNATRGEKSKASSLLTHSGSSACSQLGMALIDEENAGSKIPGLSVRLYLILPVQWGAQSPKYEIFSLVCVGHFTCGAGLCCYAALL